MTGGSRTGSPVCPRAVIITLSSWGNHFKIYYELPRCQIVGTDV